MPPSNRSLPEHVIEAIEEFNLAILGVDPLSVVVQDFSVRWEKRYGPRGKRFLLRLISILQARGAAINIERLEALDVELYQVFSMTDNSKHAGGDFLDQSRKVGGDDNSTNAGRDQKAVSGGSGNLALFKDVAFYEQHVASLGVPAELQTALKAGRKELETLALPERVKNETLRNYDELTNELGQAKPDKTTLQYFWDAIPKAAKTLSTLATLGTMLVKLHGLFIS